MALTRGSSVFSATLEQAQEMAELAGLRMEVSQKVGNGCESGPYYMWQDRATGGGGCRLVWTRGIVWVSSHSGYPQADITREVGELFAEMGCKELEAGVWRQNPHVYP